ncbi:glycosyltransferase, partial [Vibrio cholerae O1 biovar El Tor]|nr:glycosyltransferase [Vibrio cholerae O1 biovar El Tor]
TFDVVAGHVSRAPLWMQKPDWNGYIVCYKNPVRMWKRYLITNSRYAWLLLNEK